MSTCPTCSFENKTSAQHCERCGRPLGVGKKLALIDTVEQPKQVLNLRATPAEAAKAPNPGDIAAALGQDAEQRIPLGALSGDLSASLDTEQEAQQSINNLDLSVRDVTSGRNTLVEGLKAIKGPLNAPSTTEPLDVTSLPEPPTSAPMAPLEALSGNRTPTEPERRRFSTAQLALVFFLLVILLGATIGLMVTLQDDTQDQVAIPEGRTLIEAGPYLRGLANDYRLMFSQTCKKMAEDPETECKEEIALKGEIPQKSVEVAGFEIDLTEVTNGAWASCVTAGACIEIDPESCENWTLKGKVPFRRVPKVLFRPERPVVCVSREEAASFCAWADARLPSPDEWEKAARGSEGYTLPWGTNWNPMLSNWGERDMARVSIAGKLDGHADTAPVGSYGEKSLSPHGLYDMAGNVSEWVAAEEGDEALQASARGGSWRSAPLELRVTHRLFIKPEARRTDVGFRCVVGSEGQAQ